MLLGVIVAACTITAAPPAKEANDARHARAVDVARRPTVPPRRDLRLPSIRPAEVVGRVVDAFGRTVANVTVVATPALPGGSWLAPRTHSDRLGRFHFVGLPPGDYVFVALHGDHAGGVSPVMPVDDVLEVTLVVGDSVISV
jgi:hypothetical protein